MASINATTSSGIVATADNTGQLQLQSAGTTSATFNTFGIGLGSAVPSSGIGITFPAAQSASSDANTLDDYEEGTFTPSYGTTGTAPSLTYAARNGYYIRIGKMVYISLNVEAAVLSSQGTGNLNITGLPFTVSNLNSSSNSPLAVGYAASWASSQNPMSAMTFQGTTFIRPYYMSSLGANKLDSTSSGLGNNTSIWLSGCYYTDS